MYYYFFAFGQNSKFYIFWVLFTTNQYFIYYSHLYTAWSIAFPSGVFLTARIQFLICGSAIATAAPYLGILHSFVCKSFQSSCYSASGGKELPNFFCCCVSPCWEKLFRLHFKRPCDLSKDWILNYAIPVILPLQSWACFAPHEIIVTSFQLLINFFLKKCVSVVCLWQAFFFLHVEVQFVCCCFF